MVWGWSGEPACAEAAAGASATSAKIEPEHSKVVTEPAFIPILPDHLDVPRVVLFSSCSQLQHHRGAAKVAAEPASRLCPACNLMEGGRADWS